MSSNQSQPIGQIQLPKCPVCCLQPIPESVQFVPFMMLEVFLAFISIKLAAIFLLLSYCFTRSAWYCPQCKREIEINHEVQGISENLIIRIGNCMFMLSKIKFRILAAIIVSYLFYLYAVQIHQRPKMNIEKTWQSLASNCGYEMFLQNSYKANTMYAEYPILGEWTITGIYLRQQQVSNKVKKIYLKMNPTQFKNPLTEDISVVITPHTQVIDQKNEIGDVVEVKGQWEGREAQGHLFRFMAVKIHKVGTKSSPTDVKLLSAAERFIRIHEEEKISLSKEEHERLVAEKIKNITQID